MEMKTAMEQETTDRNSKIILQNNTLPKCRPEDENRNKYESVHETPYYRNAGLIMHVQPPYNYNNSTANEPPPPYTPSAISSPMLSPITPSAPLLTSFDYPLPSSSMECERTFQYNKRNEMTVAHDNDFFKHTIPLKKISTIIGVISVVFICSILVLLLVLGKM